MAEHNMPCSVCTKKHAVYDLSNGIFYPCWDCQKSGYTLIQRKWWMFWIKKDVYFS